MKFPGLQNPARTGHRFTYFVKKERFELQVPKM